MRSFFTFVEMVAYPISRGCLMRRKYRKENIVSKETVRTSELNSFVFIRACRAWRVISAQTWLAGVLILLSVPNAFAESDFSAFWQKFKSAVIGGDKAMVA